MSLKKWKGLKTIAICVLVAFTTIALRVDLLAAPKAKPQPAVQKKVTSAAKFQDLLKDTEKLFEGMETDLGKKKDITPRLAQLRQHRSDLQGLADNIRGEMAKTRTELISKKLPAEIIQRHDAFAQNFEANMKALVADLDQAEQAKPGQLQARVKTARDYLKKNIHRERHTPLDPNKLPHRTPKIERKEPRLKKEDFERDFLRPQKAEASRKPILVASNGPLKGLLASNDEQNTGNLIVAQATNQPTAGDLAETIEVQFTPEIIAKAQELENNPVKIYNWVRNNIEFVPTYGSIQGAHMTLLSKQGNAFDISSLLIALLRVSNIKARYVYGTIEVPIDKVMNWVGGFTDEKSAVDFIASGGIPVTALISGGKITKARMEHVWVEAFVDYIPSRGAVHKEGDTWIPMDGSFKQYNYKKGLDIQQISGFEPGTFMAELKQNSTFDPTTGSITNINISQVQSKIDEIKDSLKNYLQSQAPSMADIFGLKEIRGKVFDLLPATLEYKPVTTAFKTDVLPDSLRHKISFSIVDFQSQSEPLNAEYFTAYLAGKRVTLAYMPATEADARTIESAGGYFNVAPYLINLKPVLYIEGNPVTSGVPVAMGSLQELNVIFSAPNMGQESVSHRISASTFAAIGLELQRISSEFINQRYSKLDQTKNLLASQDVPLDDMIGEILNIHTLCYYGLVEGTNKLISSGKVAYLKHPSEMLATLQPNISYLWGVPYKIEGASMNVDVKRYVMSVESLEGDKLDKKLFMLASGSASSAAEHAIFEITRSSGFEGISAVKAIAYANQQGIPIYTIDSTNINTILPLLSVSSDAISDIQNAVGAGKTVVIPQSTIQYNQWIGDGYIILDSETGAGAYMIAGGLAGGGTTQEDDPVLMASIDITNVLSFIGTILKPLVQALRIGGKFAGIAGTIGYILGALSVIGTFTEMYMDTNCLKKAVAAAALDLVLNVASSLIMYVLASTVVGFIVGVLISVLLIVLENYLLQLIKNANWCYLYLRRKLYAQNTSSFMTAERSVMYA